MRIKDNDKILEIISYFSYFEWNIESLFRSNFKDFPRVEILLGGGCYTLEKEERVKQWEEYHVVTELHS